MFRLERIVLREIRLPLKEPFRISSGVVSERRICLLELFATDGSTGWSECVAGEQPNYSYETIDTAWHAIREWLAPRVWPVIRRSRSRVRDARSRRLRAQHGEGGDRDGMLGRRGPAGESPTVEIARRHARPRRDWNLDRHSGERRGARSARARGIRAGLSKDQGEDSAGRRYRLRACGAARAGTRRCI